MRGKNPELHDLRTIDVDGTKAILYEVSIPDTRKAQKFFNEKDTVYKYKIPNGPVTFYEVFSPGGEYIGRVSQAIRCDRV